MRTFNTIALKVVLALVVPGFLQSGCRAVETGTDEEDASTDEEDASTDMTSGPLEPGDACGDEPDEENPCQGDDCVVDCSGFCFSSDDLGDGSCDSGPIWDSGPLPNFNCAELDYDEGDCTDDEPSYAPLEGHYYSRPYFDDPSDIDIQTSSCDDEIKDAGIYFEVDDVVMGGGAPDPFEGTLTLIHYETLVNGEAQLHSDTTTDCVWAGGEPNQIHCEWEVVETSIIVDGATLSDLTLAFAYTLDASYRNEKYWYNGEKNTGWIEDGFITFELALKISCEGDDCDMITDHVLPTGYPYSCDTTVSGEARYFELGN